MLRICIGALPLGKCGCQYIRKAIGMLGSTSRGLSLCIREEVILCFIYTAIRNSCGKHLWWDPLHLGRNYHYTI